jgi:hypothetical protein
MAILAVKPTPLEPKLAPAPAKNEDSQARKTALIPNAAFPYLKCNKSDFKRTEAIKNQT